MCLYAWKRGDILCMIIKVISSVTEYLLSYFQ